MKRIETFTDIDRLALVRTLNTALFDGEAAYSCPGRCCDCQDCAAEPECDATYIDEPGLIRSFRGWLAWLVDDVETPAIRSGYRVLYNDCINHFHIVRPDGVNLYANGQPWALLPRDRDRNSEFVITDVFASRYGAACILAEDTYTGEMLLYSDII